MAATLTPMTVGAPIPSDAEQISPTVARPSVSADPAPRMRLLQRLQILIAIWAAEGGKGRCPTENDPGLIADLPIQ